MQRFARCRLDRIGLSIALVSVFLASCSKSPAPPVPTPAAAALPPPASASAPPWAGESIDGSDPAALRRYLATVKELVPTTFKVSWNPATVAFDKDAAMHALRAVSRDGQRFTLDPADPQTAKLVPGSILWIYDVTVSKVVRVEHVDGSIVVHTRPVALNEAIPDADIRFDAPVPAGSFMIEPRAAVQEAGPVPPGNAAAPLPRSAGALAALAPARMLRTAWPADHRHALRTQLALGPTDPPAPAAADPEPSDAAEDEARQAEDDAMTRHTYRKTLKGFEVEVAYAPLPAGGIGLRIKARRDLQQDDAGNGSAQDKADSAAAADAETKAAAALEEKIKAVMAEEKTLNAELRELRAQLYRTMESRADNGTIQAQQKAVDDAVARKAALTAKHQALKQARQDQQQKTWENASNVFDVRFLSQVDLKGFASAGHLLFAKGEVQEAAIAFKEMQGHALIHAVARLGDKGVKGTKVPVMRLPVSFSVPVPIGGIPFSVKVSADFSMNVFLAGQHASLGVEGEYSFNGNTGVTASSTGAAYDAGISGDDPKITSFQGMSPGASAFLLSVQLPRIGFGLGMFGASSMVFYDVIHVVSMTSAAEAVVGLAPACKRITYAATSRVGMETEMPLPIPVLQQLADKMSPPKHILSEKKHMILEPKIKACEIN